ncbi:MAG: PP2C family protein-serine/threonine phosphatase [Anaerolineales bacterium]
MIPAERGIFDHSVASHPGKGNETNEDRYHVETFSLKEGEEVGSLFIILADGVGSRRAGQVAAELAVETISQAVARSDASQPIGMLQAAIHQASQAIQFRAEVRPEWEGMGSTCLCAWLIRDRLFIASVGNSRSFLLRGEQFLGLNEPGTVQDKGSRDLAKESENYLGSTASLEIDMSLGAVGHRGKRLLTRGLRILPNDRILLCTDGVGDALSSREMIQILGLKDVHTAAQSLVDLAFEKGTPHNLTAAVVAVPPGRPPLAKAPVNWKRGFVASILFVLLVALGLFSVWLWQSRINPLQGPLFTPINTLTPIPTNTPQ